MYCKICGNELPDNALFCNYCGNTIKRSGSGSKNCISRKPISNPAGMPSGAPTNEPPEKKRSSMPVIIGLISIIVLLVSVIVGYMMYSGMIGGKKDSSDKNEPAKSQTTDAPAVTEEPETLEDQTAVTEPEGEYIDSVDEQDFESEPETSYRADLYDPSLTYKRMSGIHSTVLTDDDTFYELRAVITSFNQQCEDYMNEVTDNVPTYLKKGTTAYDQQIEYKQKHPLLDQTYQKVDVINARQGGGYYYVWVTEALNVSENGRSYTSTDHWVYKLEKENGRWYISDYTKDPAF